MSALELDARDRPPGVALDRWRLEAVGAGDAAAFERVYRTLADEFAARGELERREVLAGWLARRPPMVHGPDGLHQRYWLVEARTREGALAGVRDCHVVVDAEAGVAVVYLAHVVVLPAHRRAGLARVLRALPLTLARKALDELHVPAGRAEILLGAEMERPRLDEPASLVRLVAYGQEGFAVIDPRALPYAQPDFRDPALIGDAPRPVPLLAVARRVGHEAAATMPRSLAAAFQVHLDAVFATHCAPAHLAPRREHALAALATGTGEVPLLRLPRSIEDTAALRPLLSPPEA